MVTLACWLKKGSVTWLGVRLWYSTLRVLTDQLLPTNMLRSGELSGSCRLWQMVVFPIDY